MIEKLDLDNGYATVDWLPTQHGKRCGAKEIQTTVNQLIDTVNDIHFEDVPILTKKELKALAEATATMLADKSNTIITVILNKDGKPVFITR